MTAANSSPPLNLKKLVLIILSLVTIAITASILLVDTWKHTTTIIAIHSMLAFLAITCSGFILVQYRIRERSEETVFHAALFYVALINIARAIRVIFDNNLVNEYSEPSILVSNLVYLATFSFLIFSGVIMKKNEWIKKRTINSMTLIVIGVLFHILMIYIVIPIVPADIIVFLGLIFGLTTSIILPISGVMWSKTTSQSSNFELTYLIAGFTLFGVAWMPFVAALFFPSTIWILSFPLMSFGLILLCLSSAIPFQTRIGLRTRYAYFITIGLTLLSILPTSATVIAETYFSFTTFPNRELFVVLHLGASLMAAVMALLIFLYDKQQPAPKRRPIVSLFITWATIEFYQVTKALLLPEELIAQSIIPYLVGSIFLIVHIPYAIKWTVDIPEVRQANPKRVAIVAPIIFIILLVAEVIQSINRETAIGMIFEPLGRSLLLGSALIGMFAFVFHSSVQAKDSRGRMNVDVLTTGFLALWIIPSIIRANYSEWTTGWWAGEILLLMAVLFGPAILGYLYLNELGYAAYSQKRATLFADLLVHDISNYHQALAFSIGLLEMEEAGSEAKEQAIRDANIELQRADQLIRNVRRLSMADELVPEHLSLVNVIPILNEAFELASRKTKKVEIKFHIDSPSEEYIVLANALLKDVFLNLFDNSIKYNDELPEISITIKDVIRNRETWCCISFIDNGRGIDPKRRSKVFERYMDDAVGTGLGLSVVKTLIQAYGGSIIVKERVLGDYKQGTIFTIFLKKG